jgi:hypothetical protein
MKKISEKKNAYEKVYHVYLKGECILPNIGEESFKGKWSELNAMVGLMTTEYKEEDLSYELVYKPTMDFEESSY